MFKYVREKKILFIEDCLLKIRCYMWWLEKNNIQLEVAENMQAAKEILLFETEIAGVILDLGFDDEKGKYHEKQGLKILDFLNEEQMNLPVLINSSTKLTNDEIHYENILGKMEPGDSIDSFVNFIDKTVGI